MSDFLYILTDGINTKIGITNDFDKRMASYTTHNPNFQLYKSYPCGKDEARRIETAIKVIFKDALSGKSKEWFEIPADTIDRYASLLLEKPVSSIVTPSMHGVRVTNEAHELLSKLDRLLNSDKQEERLKSETVKEQMAEAFATAFALGIPEHKLPDDYIVFKDNASVDTRHCADPGTSEFVRKSIESNCISLPKDDHVWRFFHLVKLASGHFVAVCTSRVSMPYLKAIADKEIVREIVAKANQVGWNCTPHHDWSWHSPEISGLLLFQPKTPVFTILRTWEGSFRKWLIERQEVLKFEAFPDKDMLEKAIEDTARDNTFPLDIHSYGELQEKYLGPFFWIDKDGDFFLKNAYQFLIGKWANNGREFKVEVQP